MLLALAFEYGIALYDLEVERIPTGDKSPKEAWTQLRAIAGKVRRQIVKDYLAFPLLAGPAFLPVLLGNLTANLARKVWAHTIIFCGHFPDGAEVFTPEDQLEGETRGEWYVRQLLGSCNLDGGKLLHLMSGNLSHQIEHHLFPDLPSNRYPQIAPRIRTLCERFGLPYTSGTLAQQTASVYNPILRLALPGPRHHQPERATPPAPNLHAIV
jgi:linoleoyl-CoA desaturase